MSNYNYHNSHKKKFYFINIILSCTNEFSNIFPYKQGLENINTERHINMEEQSHTWPYSLQWTTELHSKNTLTDYLISNFQNWSHTSTLHCIDSIDSVYIFILNNSFKKRLWLWKKAANFWYMGELKGKKIKRVTYNYFFIS